MKNIIRPCFAQIEQLVDFNVNFSGGLSESQRLEVACELLFIASEAISQLPRKEKARYGSLFGVNRNVVAHANIAEAFFNEQTKSLDGMQRYLAEMVILYKQYSADDAKERGEIFAEVNPGKIPHYLPDAAIISQVIQQYLEKIQTNLKKIEKVPAEVKVYWRLLLMFELLQFLELIKSENSLFNTVPQIIVIIKEKRILLAHPLRDMKNTSCLNDVVERVFSLVFDQDIMSVLSSCKKVELDDRASDKAVATKFVIEESKLYCAKKLGAIKTFFKKGLPLVDVLTQSEDDKDVKELQVWTRLFNHYVQADRENKRPSGGKLNRIIKLDLEVNKQYENLILRSMIYLLKNEPEKIPSFIDDLGGKKAYQRLCDKQILLVLCLIDANVIIINSLMKKGFSLSLQELLYVCQEFSRNGHTKNSRKIIDRLLCFDDLESLTKHYGELWLNLFLRLEPVAINFLFNQYPQLIAGEGQGLKENNPWGTDSLFYLFLVTSHYNLLEIMIGNPRFAINQKMQKPYRSNLIVLMSRGDGFGCFMSKVGEASLGTRLKNPPCSAELFRKTLEKRVDLKLNVRDGFGKSPLYHIIQDLQTVESPPARQELLEKLTVLAEDPRANLNFSSKGRTSNGKESESVYPLAMTCHYRDLSAVKILLDSAKARGDISMLREMLSQKINMIEGIIFKEIKEHIVRDLGQQNIGTEFYSLIAAKNLTAIKTFVRLIVKQERAKQLFLKIDNKEVSFLEGIELMEAKYKGLGMDSLFLPSQESDSMPRQEGVDALILQELILAKLYLLEQEIANIELMKTKVAPVLAAILIPTYDKKILNYREEESKYKQQLERFTDPQSADELQSRL